MNAAVAFSAAPNPPARPFHLSGSLLSQDRAVDCLAAGALYEAGDDSDGQKAVVQVILNRVRHPAFPKTVCGVVFQGAERSTGCQFTFTCDGALARLPTTAAWERARNVARQMLSGTVDERVGYATHYHTDWVVPYWSSSLDKITSVHTHLFFRWKGWWGMPNAFRQASAEEEPVIPRLALFSPAHRSVPDAFVKVSSPAAPDFSDLARTATVIGQDRIGDRFGVGRLTAVNSGGDAFAMILDKNAAPEKFEQLGRLMCSGRQRCRMLGWTRGSEAPNAFPVGEETLTSMSYAYIRMTSAALERSLYNCREFRDRPAQSCMKDRTAGITGPGKRVGTEVIRIEPVK